MKGSKRESIDGGEGGGRECSTLPVFLPALVFRLFIPPLSGLIFINMFGDNDMQTIKDFRGGQEFLIFMILVPAASGTEDLMPFCRV